MKNFLTALTAVLVICMVCLADAAFGIGQDEQIAPPGTSVESVEGAIDALDVNVTIIPQRYFVERIGGDHVDVSVIVAAGSGGHTYDPSSRQLQQLLGAEIWFTIGIEIEERLIPYVETQNDAMLIVDTSRGVPIRYFENEEHDDEEDEAHDDAHDDAQDHDHDHDGTRDPHIWLGIPQVLAQIAAIRDTLSMVRGEFRAEFEKNYDDFVKDIEQLDETLNTLLAPHRGAHIFVAHPAFGYFFDQYGLHQRAIEFRGKDPTPAQFADLIGRVKEEDIAARILFVQPQFSAEAARRFAEVIGARPVIADPYAENWLENMIYIGELIAEQYADH